MALEALEALDSGYDSSEWAVSWSQVCETPRGHGMHGFVPDTYEEQLRDLESRFGGTYANGVRKFALMYNDIMWRVVRLCPCGKMSCSVHVISPAMEGLELADEFSREDVMTYNHSIKSITVKRHDTGVEDLVSRRFVYYLQRLVGGYMIKIRDASVCTNLVDDWTFTYKVLCGKNVHVPGAMCSSCRGVCLKRKFALL